MVKVALQDKKQKLFALVVYCKDIYVCLFFFFYCKEYVNIGQNGASLLESTDGSIQKMHGNRVRNCYEWKVYFLKKL